jgi:thymidine kinase
MEEKSINPTSHNSTRNFEARRVKGVLEVICGPMFSGKSEELIRRLRRAKIAQQNVISFNPHIDTRTALHTIASHNGTSLGAITISNPLTIPDHITSDIDVVGIDEVQFFSPDIINVVFDLVEQGKRVIVTGLNLDFRGVPFGTIPTFMAIADTVTKLSAICIVCGTDAYLTQRIVNGTPAQYDDPVVKPGAQEAYQARCRSCHIVDKKPVWQKTL